MPWVPSEHEAGWLRNQISLKFNLDKDKNIQSIDLALLMLKQAKGKKQAEAVLNNVGTYNELKLLHDYGFEKLQDNSPNTIKQALLAAPIAIAAQKAAAKAVQDTNERINGYLGTISSQYKRHQGGEHIVVPIEDYGSGGLECIARRYHNGENVLPAGGFYIEWYPVIAGSRSIHKRFFTLTNDPRLWYTEGGTHGNMTEWWVLTNEGGDWTKK